MQTTVILFHKDLLANFSARDLYTLAGYYGLEAPVDDLRWMIAIKHAEQKTQMLPGQLTGDPYLNIEIIKHLDDESLDSMCQEYPDIAWSCEEVWKTRAQGIDPKASPDPGQTWRQLYTDLVWKTRVQGIDPKASPDPGQTWRQLYTHLSIKLVRDTENKAWVVKGHNLVVQSPKDLTVYAYITKEGRVNKTLNKEAKILAKELGLETVST